MKTALITGGSKGLGYALAARLTKDGWRVVIDGRDPRALERAARSLGDSVIAVAGDVADEGHRGQLVNVVDRLGTLDLLVNNASDLGPSPLPTLDRYPLDSLRRLLAVNVIAPLALCQALLTNLRPVDGTIVNVTSDASVEAYRTWGGYGASKAALDQLTAVMGAELAPLHIYAFDPGDMRTEMHQAAFPGQDISDRPEPAEVVPALVRLLEDRPPSGRYRAAELVPAAEELAS